MTVKGWSTAIDPCVTLHHCSSSCRQTYTVILDPCFTLHHCSSSCRQTYIVILARSNFRLEYMKNPSEKNDRALECEACSYWVHIKCGGITPNEYKNFQKNTYLSWECPKCLLPNLFHSFFLDNPIELNNSYESLSSNSNTSIIDDTQEILTEVITQNHQIESYF